MPRQTLEELRAKKAAYQREYRTRFPEKAKAAVRKTTAANKAKYSASRAAKYQEDKALRDAAKLQAANWIKTHPEQRRLITGRYGAKNRATLNEKARSWKAANKPKCKIHKHRRRSRLKGATDHHTAADWEKVLQTHGACCAYCGKKGTKRNPLTRDHYIALTKGGSNAARNLVPSCKSCNSKKNNRDPIEFARSIGRLL